MTTEKLATLLMQSMAASQIMSLPDSAKLEVPSHVQRGYHPSSVMVTVFFSNERFNITITKARGRDAKLVAG